MYEKWKKYTEYHPYSSVFIVAIVASIIGITIEYLVNNNFVFGGFWVTLVLVIGQLLIIRARRKKKEK